MKKLILALCFLTLISAKAFCQEVTDQQEVIATYTADAGVAKLEWKQISGPDQVTIVSPNAAKTLLTGFKVPGVYVFQFTVTDKVGRTATTKRTGNVLPAWAGPTADAEATFEIRLPAAKK